MCGEGLGLGVAEGKHQWYGIDQLVDVQIVKSMLAKIKPFLLSYYHGMDASEFHEGVVQTEMDPWQLSGCSTGKKEVSQLVFGRMGMKNIPCKNILPHDDHALGVFFDLNGQCNLLNLESEKRSRQTRRMTQHGFPPSTVANKQFDCVVEICGHKEFLNHRIPYLSRNEYIMITKRPPREYETFLLSHHHGFKRVGRTSRMKDNPHWLVTHYTRGQSSQQSHPVPQKTGVSSSSSSLSTPASILTFGKNFKTGHVKSDWT